ncbi:hypothetical protein [Deinococcus knuensis]|uniref:Uncharacterized protein n=1 Tax=Deinococcus knuensis TaxID=1837380 RepID=A0ABQ2SCY4_9DEIO|nr:hypothetical protein [Deinococcus knuensis]GGS15738.1 hypothetical protein GCM10008961_04020 [Deinococcus knuensis]
MASRTPTSRPSGPARRVVRGAAGAARTLVRAARRDPDGPADPWNTGAALQPTVRRAGSLLALTVIGFLVMGVLVPLAILLGIGVASGSDVAGWLLALVLLLLVAFGVWVFGRARTLTRPAPVTLDAAAPPEEWTLLETYRLHERRLPTPTRPALQSAVQATREALRVTAGGTLTRDAFDARQAAREDLPELLMAWQSGPRRPEDLTRELQVIEARMRQVTQAQAAGQDRETQARARYLRDKYAPDDSSDD